MREEDYPALYRAADAASASAQSSFLRCTKGYAILSIAGGASALYGVQSAGSAIVAAILLAAALALPALVAVRQYENTWYRARAVAESVKTASWRYMMRAKPFNNTPPSGADDQALLALLRSILSNHSGLGHALAGMLAEGEQITETMSRTRRKSLEERAAFYRQHRIDEQRSWYSSKSETNKTLGRRWFWTFIGLQGAAVVFALLRIGCPEFKFWPTEVLIIAAATTLGWMYVRRFSELASAYGLAAHEIGIARAQLPGVRTETAFSAFVADTESAFSREHTQWVARRDNPV